MKEEKGAGAEAESQSQLVAKDDNKGILIYHTWKRAQFGFLSFVLLLSTTGNLERVESHIFFYIWDVIPKNNSYGFCVSNDKGIVGTFLSKTLDLNSLVLGFHPQVSV